MLLNSANQGIRLDNVYLGNKDFTIDCWAKSTGGSNSAPYFTIYFSESNFITPEIYKFYYNCYSAIDCNIHNSLNHIAVVYEHSSSRLYYFVNGKIKYNSTTNLYKSRLPFKIGFGRALWSPDSSGWSNSSMLGTISEIRISEGIARWTDNFIPPTEPYNISTEGNIPYYSDIARV